MATDTNNISTSAIKKSKKRTIALVGLGLLATSILSFFGYQYWKKNKRTKTIDEDSPDFKAENPNTATFTKKTNTSTKANPPQTKANPNINKKVEPEKKKSTLKETAEKLKDFRKNIKKETTSKLAPLIIARGLQQAYLNTRFLDAFNYLKRIETIGQYVTINKLFLLALVGRTTKSIVGALLEVFKTDTERRILYNEFKRLGLIKKGHQWSFGENVGAEQMLITTQATKVWKDPNTSVAVPLNMVLGREVCKRGTFTLFENQKQYYLVESNTVKTH